MRRKRVLEVAWATFVIGNLGVISVLAEEESRSLPFLLVWFSFAIVYGFTLWQPGPSAALVLLAPAVMLGLHVHTGPKVPRLAETPLLVAMFVAMAWHARQRASAEQEAVGARERERAFIRDASHTLKTPLALARGYSDLLAQRGLSGSQASDNARVSHELDRLARVVDDLLLLMTSDTGATIDHRALDLADVALDSVDRWVGAVDRRFVIEADDPVGVSGDRERLAYALQALIENAVAATQPGALIGVAVSSRGGVARVDVSDDGSGIPQDAVDHVFERFWSGRRVDGGKGTGLGLAIVRAVAESHGGSVAVTSRGNPTVISITLPLVTLPVAATAADRATHGLQPVAG